MVQFRFAHLINLDFFEDLLKLLHQMIESEVILNQCKTQLDLNLNSIGLICKIETTHHKNRVRGSFRTRRSIDARSGQVLHQLVRSYTELGRSGRFRKHLFAQRLCRHDVFQASQANTHGQAARIHQETQHLVASFAARRSSHCPTHAQKTYKCKHFSSRFIMIEDSIFMLPNS